MSVKPLAGLSAIPMSLIKPSPNNVREQLTDIAELAQSIAENGLIQPLVVQRVPGAEHFQIVAGHRRFAAALRLKWTTCPCIIRRDMLPDEELLAMLVENGQRADLDPIEEARALNRMRKAGASAAEIGRKIGRPVSYVDRRLMLLRLSPEEQERLRAGHYTLGHAQGLVVAGRKAERQRQNPVSRPVGRPQGVRNKPYFGDSHPLAQAARAVCAGNGHGKGVVKVGAVACGPCWELVIRSDAERTAVTPEVVSC